ncbi:MAG: YggS family pyridoxal phosphate-dependent enzyme [Candidatus Diapherotrites archaeon]|uniref:Pyridoxal phosphate homeostasis protein n=1 Tax=Candidatus Iainarchaeum sp. TaxID=3101447 RepID=A0A939CAF9_9ARCH|nr:YggS family pyridoxal phosphate-dependent enzyme [Candidatus Diapherotrites archaeon]
MSNSISRNFQKILQNISLACSKSGRPLDSVKVLAATKSQPIEKINAAIDAGISVCGENYVQEAERKISEIGNAVEWHFIGHLQGNKARKAVELFDCIQAVDSAKLARKINDAASGKFPIFIEVNIAREETKFGVPPEKLPSFYEELRQFPNLQVRGLFCMAPFLSAEEVRPYFQKMQKLSQELALNELSMGMSSDFQTAVEQGSTMVRVGTALFGERE